MTKRKHPLLFTALALFLTAIFIVANTAMSQALVLQPTQDPAEEASESVAYVYESLNAWRDRLLVNEFTFGDIAVMQAYLVVDSIEDPGMAMDEFSTALFTMLDARELPHQRMFLDMVTASGERLESYDLVAELQEIETATFDRFLTDTPPVDPDPIVSDGEVVEIGQTFTLETAELTVTEFDILDDGEGAYVKIWLDYTNHGEEAESAFMAVDYAATQGDVALESHRTLDDDFETTYADVAPGETMTGCTVAFYLDNESEDVTIQFKKFLGEAEAQLPLVITGVG